VHSATNSRLKTWTQLRGRLYYCHLKGMLGLADKHCISVSVFVRLSHLDLLFLHKLKGNRARVYGDSSNGNRNQIYPSVSDGPRHRGYRGRHRYPECGPDCFSCLEVVIAVCARGIHVGRVHRLPIHCGQRSRQLRPNVLVTRVTKDARVIAMVSLHLITFWL
jgi:hypothetical protein